MSDKLTTAEKIALASLGAGNAFNILLFAMGATLNDATAGAWLYIRVVFAVVQFIAFDLTIITTVQAMRDGRRSYWAGLTVTVASLCAVAIAIDVSTYRMPFMHAAYALVLPLFMMHIASVSSSVNPHITSLQAELTQTRIERDKLSIELTATRQIVNAIQINLSTPVGTKREDVKALVDSGETITAAARKIGVSRQTATKYVKGS